MSTRVAVFTFLICAACGSAEPQITPSGRAEAQVSARPALTTNGAYAAVSHDGRLFAYVDWSVEPGNGFLALRDMSTGETRPLTNPQVQDGDVERIRFSSDGRQVAYAFYVYATDRYEVRVTAIDGSGTRSIASIAGEGEWYEVAGWSAGDSAVIAVGGTFGELRSGGARALRIPLTGGPPTVLELGSGLIDGSVVSPDGRYLAYHLRERWDAPNADVYVRALDSAETIRITSSQTGEYVIAWDPRGIYFLTHEEGSPTVWLQGIREGRAAGAPIKVLSEVWGIQAGIGVGADRLFYRVPTREMQVMEIALGDESAVPVPLSDPIRGDWIAPGKAWSPDGALLAYARRDYVPWTGHNHTLVLREVATRLERTVPMPLFTAEGMKWQDDRKGLLLVGTSYDGARRELHRFDVASGTFTLLAHGDTVRIPRYSPDGGTIYRMLSEPVPHLAAIDVATGAHRRLWEGRGQDLVVSPDGSWIAFEEIVSDGQRVRIVATATGETRVLHEIEAGLVIGFPVWTRDGTAVIAIVGHNAASAADVLRIPLDGGEPAVLLRRAGLNYPIIQPDGRSVAYITSREEPTAYGVWSIDNLSAVTGNR